MRNSTFSIERGQRFPGITNGSLWNGWACPWFRMETMREIQKWVEDPVNDILQIEGERIFEIWDTEKIELETMIFEGVTYYHISGWCWDEV